METETLSKGEQTRAQIIEAAHQLFLKQGYHATSMREIARQSGLALGGIYNHFANKEEIFEAVYYAHHPITQLMPAIKQAHGGTFEEIMKDIARLLVQELQNQPDFINFLLVDIVEFQSRYTSKVMEQELPFVRQIYQQIAAPAGSRLRNVPPLIFARSFFGLFFSYFMTGRVLNTVPNAPAEIRENDFEYFVDIYLHGILSQDTPDNSGENL